MKENKKEVVLLMGVIILILFVLCILFATNTINLSSKKTGSENHPNSNTDESSNRDNNEIDYENIYLNFINNQEYNKDIPDEYPQKSYSIIDINSDGIDELLIRFKAKTYGSVESEWDYNSIYSYENNKVIFIETIYSWGGIKYNESTNEIIYTSLKTTGIGNGERINSFGYYKLINNKLELNKSISYVFNINTNVATYSEVSKDGAEREITNNQREQMVKNEKQLPYTDII